MWLEMAKKGKPTLVKAPCSSCGGERNHVVVSEHNTTSDPDEDGYYFETSHQIIRCQGCEDLRFREIYADEFDLDENDQPLEHVTIYPDQARKGRPFNKELGNGLPTNVVGMYKEALGAFNAGAKVLAGGGLRAIVEAICKDRAIAGINLQKKIDRLVEAGLLAQPQADLLHEERFIGNAALHELEAPPDDDLTIGFEIIEALLITIYVLPDKAKKLKDKRVAAQKKSS